MEADMRFVNIYASYYVAEIHVNYWLTYNSDGS